MHACDSALEMRRVATKDGVSKRRGVLGRGKVVSRATERRHHGTSQVAVGQYGVQCTVVAGKVGIEGKRRCFASS
jgi:hypothetical protein